MKGLEVRSNLRYMGGAASELVNENILKLFAVESVSDFIFLFSFTYISELNTDNSVKLVTTLGETVFFEESVNTKSGEWYKLEIE
ncbi:MAG: hypothetical protein PVH88_10415 [Ignavibacteria bacterium]|jgi:hypothetical protein